MEALKQQLLRIQQQLSALSASQKMLTVSILVIMIMTMFYWSRFAGTAEKVALLDQPMSADEITQIKSALSSRNVSYVVQGDRILVPTDKKFELVAELGYAQLLPSNFEDGFKEIVLAHGNPFDSQKRSDQLANHARERTLGGLIQRFPGVRTATVMIDGTSHRSPSRPIESTAAISITTKRPDDANRKLAIAAAEMVAGSQAGLSRDRVKVTINGQPFQTVSKEGTTIDADNPILKARADAEQHYITKIQNQLLYIPNIYATVSVDLNTRSSVINERKYDPKNKVEAVKRSTSSEEENAPAEGTGEPGLNSNATATIDQGSAGDGKKSSSSKSDTENEVAIGHADSVTQAPAGDALAVTAAVRVPESYFVNIWKRRNPTATGEPTEKALEDIIAQWTPQIVAEVKAATAIKDAESISVARYVDAYEPAIAGDTAAAGLASMPTGLGFGAKEIAIAVLAVISLFMVSMMVRKSVPQPVIRPVVEEEKGPKGPSEITAIADLAGEVGEGGMLLTAQELSETEMESKQVIEQVGTMVKENPDAAANLVKRWLSRE